MPGEEEVVAVAEESAAGTGTGTGISAAESEPGREAKVRGPARARVKVKVKVKAKKVRRGVMVMVMRTVLVLMKRLPEALLAARNLAAEGGAGGATPGRVLDTSVVAVVVAKPSRPTCPPRNDGAGTVGTVGTGTGTGPEERGAEVGTV